MKEKHFLFWLYLYWDISMISAIHPTDFEKTKAEDFDSSVPTDQVNSFTSCDLTSGFCDTNCCNDQDCSEDDKASFLCFENPHLPSSHYNFLKCENIGSLDSLGNPLLCLDYENSPYLGEFYVEDGNMSELSFLSIINSRNKVVNSFRIRDLTYGNNDLHYKYGSDIFFVDPMKGHQHIYIQSNILSKGNGYCSKEHLRFLVNKASTCFYLMSNEECSFNKEFHTQYHLNVLNKIEYLGDVNNVNVTYNTVCLGSGTDYVSVLNKNFNTVIRKQSLVNYNVTQCKVDTLTSANEITSICENVVVGLNYTIYFSGKLLKAINVTVFIANIPLNVQSFLLIDQKNITNNAAIYVSQKINVQFVENEKDNSLVRNGYVTGQHLFLDR